MKLKVFAVYDSKAETYSQPHFMLTRGQAIRAWEVAVNDPETQFCRHPADFTFFELGEYDQLSGTFEQHKAKVSLGVAVEFKKVPASPAPLFAHPSAAQAGA